MSKNFTFRININYASRLGAAFLDPIGLDKMSQSEASSLVSNAAAVLQSTLSEPSRSKRQQEDFNGIEAGSEGALMVEVTPRI